MSVESEISAESEDFPKVCVKLFDDSFVSIAQEHRVRGPVGTAHHDNTGWQVWECSNVMLRYLLNTDLMKQSPMNLSSLIGINVLDLSAGAGLLACSLAAGSSCHVIASDTSPQLPQLLRNVQRNKIIIQENKGSVLVRPFYWGSEIYGSRLQVYPNDCMNWLHETEVIKDTFKNQTKVEEKSKEDDDPSITSSSSLSSSSSSSTVLSSSPSNPWFDLCVVSDVLYIALRDGLDTLLRKTLRQLSGTNICSRLLFAFEERLIHEEEEFMSTLGGFDDVDGLNVSVIEIENKYCKIEKEQALRNVGGLVREETLAADIFWEPPPVRMFVLKKCE
jgi:predicted nicotinamide N-methyase